MLEAQFDRSAHICKCPICQSEESELLYPEYEGRCITSQMFFLDNVRLDNRCCANCGFIYNRKGIRGREIEVYNKDVWKPKPQIISFQKNVMATHQRALNVFRKIANIPEQGSLLDFGAGTGAFLQHFKEIFPNWALSAIEPGDGFMQLVENLPLKEAFNKPYYELEISDSFDVTIVMSVLEHVSDPLGALRWIHRALKPGGLLLMQHPNFALLPGDLFCADHINKLTPEYTRKLCKHSGFEMQSEDATMVSFYQVYRKADHTDRMPPELFHKNFAIARESERIAKNTILAVGKAVDAALSKGRNAGVFGTSPIGSMAHLMLNCKSCIACFVDENANMWGREIDGIPIVGPDRADEFGVSDIGIAISPLYWHTVAEKMKRHGIVPHVPHSSPIQN